MIKAVTSEVVAHDELERDWCFQGLSDFLRIGTNASLPGPYGPDSITQTGLSLVTRGSSGISVAPCNVIVFSMLPSFALESAIVLCIRPWTWYSISLFLLSC